MATEGRRKLTGRKLAWARSLAAFFSLAIGFAFVEAFMRLTATRFALPAAISGAPSGEIGNNANPLSRDTPRGRRLIPHAEVVIKNHFLSARDVEVRVNSYGFRGEDFPPEKPVGEIRILALGDSITCGDYLPETETYPAIMEARLNAHKTERTSSSRFRVINAGLSDTGTREELLLLEDQGLRVHPNWVLLQFYLNDSRPPWGFPGELGRPGWLRRNSIAADSLFRVFKLQMWIREQGEGRFGWPMEVDRLPWKTDREAFLKLADLAKYDWGAAWRDDSWTSLESEWDKLAELSKQHGFRVAVVAFPATFQIRADFVEDKPQRLLRERAESHGFAYFDLLPLMREHASEDLYFDHCHPNVPGNILVGEALADFLMAKIKDTP